MRRKGKRFLSALLACTLIISIFPFTAFANDGVTANDANSLKMAIQNAEAGSTVTIPEGTYEIDTIEISKPVSLVGEGNVVLKGSVTYKQFSTSPDETNKTIEWKNITLQPPTTDDNKNHQGLCFSTGVTGYTINIDGCNFDGWRYAIGVNSGATDNSLKVTNSAFTNTFCAMSVKTGNTLSVDETVTTANGCFAVQQFGSGQDATNNYYQDVTDFTSKENAIPGTSLPNNGQPTAWEAYMVDGSGKYTYGTLKDLVESVSDGSSATIDVVSDVTLSAPIAVNAGANVTVNGNGNSVSYPVSVSTAFGYIQSGTKLAVKDLIFNITDVTEKPATGFGILTAENTNGIDISVDGCMFNNIYSGVYFGHFEGENSGTLNMKNCTFNNCQYAYSIDEVTGGATVGSVTVETEDNDLNGAQEEETWDSVEAYVTRDGVTTVAASFADALTNAQNGDTITLAKDLDRVSVINLPDSVTDVTLDGDGHTLTYTGDATSAFIDITKGHDNVTIQNITINAGNANHGVQFYCNDGGTLKNATINGGAGTSVMVNGATNVSIADSDLNPGTNAWANIEYGMGDKVTTIPSMSIDNVSFDSSKPYVWADKDTTDRMRTEMTDNSVAPTNDQIIDKILDSITYTSPNGGNLIITVGFSNVAGITTGTVESTYQPPYTGKYSYEVKVDKTTNGSISVDKYVTEGDKVTITVTPDKAYMLDALTVTDKNGDEVTLTDNKDGTYTFTMPSSNVKIVATFEEDPNYEEPSEPETPSMPFTDVNEGDWFYDVVQYAYDNGLMTGTSATTFEPNTSTTRGMIVAVLNRLEGGPTAEAAGFTDVNNGDWYADAVNWAASVGIVNGFEDNTFRANDPITREQMAAILYNYADYKGYDVSERADLSGYADADSISSWALDTLEWANAEGLITGMSADTIAPQGQATRAQVAAMFERFIENIAE